jgi:flavin reductase (DIM6/NTAB) family NADH-FMN oxidoreductase RutF
MTGFVTLETRNLSPEEGYKMVIGAVVPRPVAWITTIDAQGRVNAAPFSSYNYVCSNPPMLAVNIGERGGELKDTARNMVANGEFVVNVATEDMLEPVHASAADYPPEVSEPEELGIELMPGQFTRVPRIAGSPVQMECRLTHTLPLGKGSSSLYIGEVIAFHVASEIFEGGRIDSVRLRPIARLGGPLYSGLGTIWKRAMLGHVPVKGASAGQKKD